MCTYCPQTHTHTHPYSTCSPNCLITSCDLFSSASNHYTPHKQASSHGPPPPPLGMLLTSSTHTKNTLTHTQRTSILETFRSLSKPCNPPHPPPLRQEAACETKIISTAALHPLKHALITIMLSRGKEKKWCQAVPTVVLILFLILPEEAQPLISQSEQLQAQQLFFVLLFFQWYMFR